MWIKMGKVVAVAAFVLTMALVEGVLQTTLKRHSAHTGLTTRSRTLRMSASPMSGAMDMLVQIPSMPIAAEVGDVGYSSVSLYFTLALYVLTLPGLYSLVTRSAKGGKAVQKVFDVPGPANPTARSTRQTAAEVMAYFKAMNYQVAAAEEVITFKGVMGQSKSQAAFLTFCTFMGFGSLALVISILLPDVGAKAYALCLLSPYAGIYYWNNAQRVDEVKIKMETSDDEQTTSIIAEGGKEDLERFSKALMLPERGKVYIKGMFDEGMGTGAGAAMSVPSDASTDNSGVGFGSKDK
jgi:Cofactor assembly of complex C subunit B